MGWNSDNISSQQGKVFVVTGGNSGVGFATVNILAAKGATVVLACRNLDKGNAALSRIHAATPDADVAVEQLDLASLASVKAFAQRMTSLYQRLDVLINNAGVMAPPQGHTEDGFEIQLGTNYLGHFALTGHLLPLLWQTPNARVVTLSSIAHWFGRIDFDNLNAERNYAKWPAYCQSKLADLVFAYELQRRFARAGAPVISVGAHPGGTRSDLGRHSALSKLMMNLLLQPAEIGALPSLMAAIEPSVKGGDYVGPGDLLTLKGLPTVQKSSALSHDPALAVRLWDAAQKLTTLAYL